MKNLFLLIKPASSLCNMRCGYCFYADLTDHRNIKSHGLMQLSLLETLVRKALAQVTESCVFGFQGGEPTLAGLDFFRQLTELVKTYNVNKAKISYSLQTNGLTLDEDWARFLMENRFLVGLSIDAAKQVHDNLRFDAAGKGTHNRCIHAARLLTKHHVEFNILSVVTRDLAAHPDKAYRFYKQNNFRYIQFIPCLDGLNDEANAHAYSLNAKAYGNFLCRIFDLWYADFIKGDYYSIRTIDNYIRMLAGQAPENCAMNGICTTYALIEADGSVYPCDFYAVDEHLLGNVLTHNFDEMLTGEVAKSFVAPSRHIDSACDGCAYHFICRGGCRRDREPMAGGQLSLNRFCEAYKLFFAHTLPRMTAIARNLSTQQK